MRATAQQPDRQHRLLETAVQVFARHGFHDVRVRDLCERAQVNLEAINDHFGDKQGLYQAVLRHAFRGLAGEDPADIGIDADESPKARLQAFIRTLFSQLLCEGRAATYAKLIAREMVAPTEAFVHVVEDGIRPQVEVLSGVVRELLGPDAEATTVRRCASSVLGQCLFYHFAHPAILQIPLEVSLQPENIESLASHVTAFSLAAIRQMASFNPTS